MSLVGIGGLGAGAAAGARFTQTRGRIQGGVQGVAYPSPFFDVAHTYLPVTVKQLFRWCRYYFLTNPLINATVFKLSEYPITDIIIDHEDSKVKRRWTEYFQDHLAYRGFQVEVGLDYHTYGNNLTSIGFPFKKYLRCSSCRLMERADLLKDHWVFTNYAFRLTCPKCGQIGDAEVSDQYYRDANAVRLIRWNPEDVDVSYNDITGDYQHYYSIPAPLRNDLIVGRKDIVTNVPQVFITALKQQKGVVFTKDNLFHMRRPTLATQDRGWGTPLLLPVLKDAFYLQLMKKSQEAVLLDHLIPLRILFPQAGSGTSDPYTTINLVDWRDHVSTEIARWRLDPNYIPLLPLPVGYQQVGGEGRTLLLTQEIQTWSEQIMMGMTVPIEFLKGGMSYAGTNVSMRMLENAFIGYIIRHRQLIRFVMKQVAAYMGWPEANIRFKPFKMADDLQRRALEFQLNQAGKISDTTLLSGLDFNQEDENEIMRSELDVRMDNQKKQQLAMAAVQGEAQLVMAKFQVKAQQLSMQAQASGAAPGEPGAMEQQAAGTPGGQEAETVPMPQELQVMGPDGTPVQAAPRPQLGAPPSDFLAAAGSQLSAGQRMDGPEGGKLNVDLLQLATMQAQQIAAMPPEQQEMAIANLQAQSPELASMVQALLSKLQVDKSSKGKAGPQVETRPLPDKLPPRRANGVI